MSSLLLLLLLVACPLMMMRMMRGMMGGQDEKPAQNRRLAAFDKPDPRDVRLAELEREVAALRADREQGANRP